MKSILVGSAAIAALVGFGGAAHASELYARASVGQTTNASISGVNFNDGMAYGAGVGGAVGPVRVELGADRLSGNLGGVISGHALVYSATGYVDLPVGAVTLSAGAGVDYANGEVHGPFGSGYSASGKGYHWAIQGSTRVAEHVILQAEFRHINVDMGSPGTLTADQITAGIRVPFVTF